MDFSTEAYWLNDCEGSRILSEELDLDLDFLRLQNRKQQVVSAAMIPRKPIGTATPMPIFDPVERPCDWIFCIDLAGVVETG
jgi:hypothetical protein